MSADAASQSFRATLVTEQRGHVRLPLPFDPREVWGRRQRHYVCGTVAGVPFDGSVGIRGGQAFLVLNAQFRTAAGVASGDTVDVTIGPVDKPRAD